MEATITHKKKIIDLKEDTFKALSVMAARQGTNLKRLIENLLDKMAEEYDESEAYRYLSENHPDRKVMLENETVWLTQAQMVELFCSTKQNISLHINNIYKEGELEQGAGGFLFSGVLAHSAERSKDARSCSCK